MEKVYTDAMALHVIPATTSGRYLEEGPESPRAVVFSFHGYGQNAEENLADIRRIRGSETLRFVAVQALHWFYRSRSDEVVASWMTRLDRDQAIGNNVAYVRNVVDRVRHGRPRVPFFFAGFSQGTAMAWRAAASIPGSAGVIILGGDLPPDVTDVALLPPILLGRGMRDDWYTEEKLQRDLGRLQAARVETCEFDGGHEWGEAFLERASRFLEQQSAAAPV